MCIYWIIRHSEVGLQPTGLGIAMLIMHHGIFCLRPLKQSHGALPMWLLPCHYSAAWEWPHVANILVLPIARKIASRCFLIWKIPSPLYPGDDPLQLLCPLLCPLLSSPFQCFMQPKWYAGTPELGGRRGSRLLLQKGQGGGWAEMAFGY